MKKVFRVVLNVLVWTVITVIGGLMTVCFMIGWAEGDLSHGLFYYLNN